MQISIITPLNKLIHRAQNLSRAEMGDLTVKLDDSGKDDEIAMASKAINAFIEKVRENISDAKNLSSEKIKLQSQTNLAHLHFKRKKS